MYGKSFLGTLALSVLALAPAGSRESPSPIDHQPVACITAGSFARLSARFGPTVEVARARVFFRAAETPHWYYVEYPARGKGAAPAMRPWPAALGVLMLSATSAWS